MPRRLWLRGSAAGLNRRKRQRKSSAEKGTLLQRMLGKTLCPLVRKMNIRHRGDCGEFLCKAYREWTVDRASTESMEYLLALRSKESKEMQ